MRQFLDVLGDEWMELSGSRAAGRALAEWGDPALDGFADLREVVAAIQRRGRPVESDRILLALLRRAGSDNLAARAVLQALMPGLKTLMVAYQLTGEPEEVAADVEAAFERIRHYPCDRRPARVAANLLADTRQLDTVTGAFFRINGDGGNDRATINVCWAGQAAVNYWGEPKLYKVESVTLTPCTMTR